MRRREPPRVVGPYQERTRWRIVVVDNGQRKSFFCASREEATWTTVRVTCGSMRVRRNALAATWRYRRF
jgi:hypothetical protein